MSRVRRRVVVVSPLIQAGGGPAGYTHNLMAGIEQLRAAGALANSFGFAGRRAAGRVRATGEGGAIAVRARGAVTAAVRLLGMQRLAREAVLLLSPWARRARTQIRGAELAVFHGFQRAALPAYAERLGKAVAYMPHSPSIFADEYRMLCELAGEPVDRSRYLRIVEEEASLVRMSRVIVFPSKGAASSYEDAFGRELAEKEIVYIKSGVDVPRAELASSAAGEPRGQTSVLYAGRYVSHKGYDIFCAAAELLSGKLEGVSFASVGAGPLKRDTAAVTDLGWRDDIWPVLGGAGIVAVPNRIAYYDLLPLECAALGKPMVMTAVGGSPDQLRDLPDTVACPEASAEALARAIVEAVGLRRANPSWGERNREAYTRLFTARELARRWDGAISELRSLAA